MNLHATQMTHVETKILKRKSIVLKRRIDFAKEVARRGITNLSHKGNQWDALRASHLLASKKPLSSVLVGGAGLEPPLSAALSVRTLPSKFDVVLQCRRKNRRAR